MRFTVSELDRSPPVDSLPPSSYKISSVPFIKKGSEVKGFATPKCRTRI